jgi:hypothetical protein
MQPVPETRAVVPYKPQLPTEPAKWYRFEDRRYSVSDPETGEHDYTRHDVELKTFTVAGYTPKGVWLRLYFTKRWVKYGARRRFACPTIAEALESYVARKNKQEAIYQARADAAKRCKVIAMTRWGKADAKT